MSARRPNPLRARPPETPVDLWSLLGCSDRELRWQAESLVREMLLVMAPSVYRRLCQKIRVPVPTGK